MFVSHTQRSIYRPGDILVIQFLYRVCRPPRHNLTGRIMSINISNDTIGNRTRDLRAYSALLQQIEVKNI